MLRWLRAFLLIGLLPGVVGCDHGSKHLACQWLAGHRVVDVVPGVLDLRLAPNRDTAFSLLGGHLEDPARRYVILAMTGLVLIGAIAAAIARWRAAPTLERIAFLVLIGGATGNFAERLGRGYVVDFIHLAHWPVFNVADVAIVVGVGLLVVAGRRPREPAPG
jgi:signal peptidase II